MKTTSFSDLLTCLVWSTFYSALTESSACHLFIEIESLSNLIYFFWINMNLNLRNLSFPKDITTTEIDLGACGLPDTSLAYAWHAFICFLSALSHSVSGLMVGWRPDLALKVRAPFWRGLKLDLDVLFQALCNWLKICHICQSSSSEKYITGVSEYGAVVKQESGNISLIFMTHKRANVTNYDHLKKSFWKKT